VSALRAAVRCLPGKPIRAWSKVLPGNVAVLEGQLNLWAGPAELLPEWAHRYARLDVALALHPDDIAALDAEAAACLHPETRSA
jgi:hypothetical protein